MVVDYRPALNQHWIYYAYYTVSAHWTREWELESCDWVTCSVIIMLLNGGYWLIQVIERSCLAYCSGGSKGGGLEGLNPHPQKKNHHLKKGFPYDLVIYWERNSAQYALDCMIKPLEIKHFPAPVLYSDSLSYSCSLYSDSLSYLCSLYSNSFSYLCSLYSDSLS